MVGRTVKFPCPSDLIEDVDWTRLATSKPYEKHIYLGVLGLRALGRDPRFTVLDKNHSHTLVIQNVTISDTAKYRCDEDMGFGHRHFFGLTVVEGAFHFYIHYVILLRVVSKLALQADVYVTAYQSVCHTPVLCQNEGTRALHVVMKRQFVTILYLYFLPQSTAEVCIQMHAEFQDISFYS